MKLLKHLRSIYRQTDRNILKSMSIIYLTIFLFGVSFTAIILHFIETKTNHEDIINYSGKQRMYSQKIALDVVLYSKHKNQDMLQKIKSDFADMKANTIYLDKFFKEKKLSENLDMKYWYVREKSKTYTDLIQAYIESPLKRNEHEMIVQSNIVLPLFDSVVSKVVEDAKYYNQEIFSFLLILIIVASIVFFFETVFIIIPLIKEYSSHYNRVIDSEFKLKLAAESAHLGIWRYNIRTTKLEWDKTMYNIYDIENLSETVEIGRWRSYIIKEFSDLMDKNFIESLNTGSSFNTEFKIRSNRGVEKYVTSSFMKVKDKSNDMIVIGVNSDITEFKRLQLEMQEAKESAQMANEAKSDFLANISHEIRTPLHGIIGLSKIMSETTLSDTQQDYLQRIIASSDLLLQIVNDVLDFSKIEANKLALLHEEFSISTILEKLSIVFGYTAYSKNLDFRFFISPYIPENFIGDELRLTQILINLLGNAFKFTENGFVEMYASSKNIENDVVELTFDVVDTGIGIEPKVQDNIFLVFQQGNSATSKRFGGTGLGLAITKRLIEMMDGNISVTSNPGKGSKFTFSIKLTKGSKSTDFTSLPPLKYSKIFILSDIDQGIEYIRELLKARGCETEITEIRSASQEISEIKSTDLVIIGCNRAEDKKDCVQKILTGCNPNAEVIIIISEYERHLFEKLLSNKDFKKVKILASPLTPSLFYEAIREKDTNEEFLKKEHLTHTLTLAEGKSALLVEDNETNRLIGVNLLEKIGFTVHTAENGLDGVNKVMKNKYDIIFMDIQMPIMDGYEAVKKIREFNRYTPIIGMSAGVMERDKENAQQAGFNYHLGKPIVWNELCNSLSNYFEMRNDEKSEKSQDSQPLAKVSYLDMEYLNGMFKDKKLIAELLSSFLQSFGNADTEWINFSVDSDDIKERIHGLKGVTGNLCFKQVYEMSISFEKESDILAKKHIFDSIIEALKGLNEEIKAEIKKIQETPES